MDHVLAPHERIVFPLDGSDLDDAKRWLDRLAGQVGVFKVGLELFVAAGPEAVREVHARGARCFLDLKLHDIPATMAGAARRAAELEVAFLTVHASAGTKALAEVAAATRGTRTTVLAVTVLTSMAAGDLTELGWPAAPRDVATRLASIATGAGVGGLVCSPEEVRALRAAAPHAVLMVPGIRPAGSDLGDQARVATPRTAREEGADYLVIGRPIRQASDASAMARRIADEIAEAAR